VSLAADIRVFAEQQGQFFLFELYAHLGAQSEGDKDRARYAAKDLVRAGTLIRLSPGLLEWVKDGRKGRPRVKTVVIWRLMRYARRFTKEQIAIRSGATPAHVKRCTEAWMREEAIQRLGFQVKGQTREAIYQVVSDQVDAPPVSRKKGATA
jgi:hypothetical protein